MEKNDRFPLLTSIARIFWFIGTALFGVGVVASLAGVVLSIFASRRRDQATLWLIVMGGGVGVLFAGLWLLSSAERIAVLFAIERNTRDGAEYFRSRESHLPKFSSGAEEGDA